MEELSLVRLFPPWRSLSDEGSKKFPTHPARQCVGMVGAMDSEFYPSVWDSGVILYQHAASFSADIHSIKCLGS